MSGQLSFWAQSSDNASDDVMAIGARLLPLGAPERQGIMSEISAVARGGTTVSKTEMVTLVARQGTFLLELVSDGFDAAGRRRPLLCLGEYPDRGTTEWAQGVVRAVREFASGEALNRTLSDQVARDAEDALVAGSQKKKTTNWSRLVTMAAVVLLVGLALAWWIYVREPG